MSSDVTKAKYEPRVDAEVLRFIGLLREAVLELPGHPGSSVDYMTHNDFRMAVEKTAHRYMDKEMP